MTGVEVDVVAGPALGASTPFLLSAMICTNMSLILLTALANLSNERDTTSLDASHAFGASDVPGPNAAPATAVPLPAAGVAASGNPDGTPLRIHGSARRIHGST